MNEDISESEVIKNREHTSVEHVDFELLFEFSTFPALVLRPDFSIIAVNNRFLEIVKMDRSELLDKKIIDVHFLQESSDDNTELRASLERVLHNLKPDAMKVTFLERYWQPSNNPILSPEGELKYIVYQIEDITKYVQIQKKVSTAELANLELKEVQNFLESILENIPNMVFVKEAKNLKFVKLNKAGEELLGYPEGDLVGKNDYDFFPASQADFFTQKDRSVLITGEILDIPEEPIHTRYKGDRILHTKKVPLYDKNGNSLFLVGISEDITDKINLIEARLAQKSAEEIASKKSKFLDIAAHELRTPITSLSLLLQLALRQIEKEKPLTEDFINRLLAPADRLKRLVIDLLDMSRLERGLVELEPVRSDINLLVFKCLQDFQLQAPKRTFIFNKKNPIEAVFDPVRINQVLSNFIDNAIKYTTEGNIEINVEEQDDRIHVSVKDHGPGIPSNQQKSLFSAFSRGSSESTIKASGLGLGLSVSKGIIDLHGGQIGLESIEGQGSTFYFEIPKKDPI